MTWWWAPSEWVTTPGRKRFRLDWVPPRQRSQVFRSLGCRQWVSGFARGLIGGPRLGRLFFVRLGGKDGDGERSAVRGVVWIDR